MRAQPMSVASDRLNSRHAHRLGEYVHPVALHAIIPPSPRPRSRCDPLTLEHAYLSAPSRVATLQIGERQTIEPMLRIAPGRRRRMFAPMAFTVVVAVLGSLLLALTYVPMISSFLLQHVEEKPARWFEAVRARYRRDLDRALAHRRAVVLSAVALLVVALGSVPFLGTEFMPKLDEGSMLIETRRLPSTSLPQGMAIAKEVERTLLRLREVQSIVTKMGRPELATETMGLYAGDVYVTFKPRDQWKTKSVDALIVQMDSVLKDIPGPDYNFTAPMAMRLDEAISACVHSSV
jgi:cobalt-zinc-cadmium resistance protein CzcA